MLDQLNELETEARQALEDVTSQEDLAAWRATYLGRKGKLTTSPRSRR